MNGKSLRSIFATVAVVSLVIYALACRSAVSPDGRHVLVPLLIDEAKDKEIAVLLVDRHSGEFRRLLSLPHSDNGFISVAWAPDSRAALVLTPAGQKDTLELIELPVDDRGPTRVFHLSIAGTKGDAGIIPFVIPPVALGKKVIISGANLLLDRVTGESRELPFPPKTAVVFSLSGDTVFYMARDQEDDDAKEKEKDAPNFMEVGSLNPSDFAPRQAARFPLPAETKTGFFFAPAPDGRSFAFALGTEDTGPIDLAIHDGSNLRRSPITVDGQPLRLGNLQWSRSGGTIFAAGFRALPAPAGKDKEFQLGVCEISVPDFKARFTPVAVTAEKDEAMFVNQIDLAPDETYAVISAAYIKQQTDAAEPNHGLFIVDLRGSARKVTRVPLLLPARP
jgi:hypothetical protein